MTKYYCWLIGSSGSGKTTVIDKKIADILGCECKNNDIYSHDIDVLVETLSVFRESVFKYIYTCMNEKWNIICHSNIIIPEKHNLNSLLEANNDLIYYIDEFTNKMSEEYLVSRYLVNNSKLNSIRDKIQKNTKIITNGTTGAGITKDISRLFYSGMNYGIPGDTNLAVSSGYEIVYIFVYCPLTVCIERTIKRSINKFKKLIPYKSYEESINSNESAPCLVTIWDPDFESLYFNYSPFSLVGQREKIIGNIKNFIKQKNVIIVYNGDDDRSHIIYKKMDSTVTVNIINNQAEMANVLHNYKNRVDDTEYSVVLKELHDIKEFTKL